VNSPTNPPLLEIDEMSFTWPGAASPCLAIERFDVHAGEAVFVRGPSGCGKSTLLSLVAGVLTASAGSVRLLGEEWKARSASRRDRLRADHVGYVFQQFNLLPYLSVLDNVTLPCRFSARRAERAAAQGGATLAAQRLLEQVSLGSDYWSRNATQLSVGQQQRVAAARALIGQPELVIADEPTSALDETLRDAFVTMLRQACTDAGSALIFVSHDARLASRFTRQVDLPLINHALHGASMEVAA
jgi:putative ABC transport system ATP-binding protein